MEPHRDVSGNSMINPILDPRAHMNRYVLHRISVHM
jgi:hypothetical protein